MAGEFSIAREDITIDDWEYLYRGACEVYGLPVYPVDILQLRGNIMDSLLHAERYEISPRNHSAVVEFRQIGAWGSVDVDLNGSQEPKLKEGTTLHERLIEVVAEFRRKKFSIKRS